MKSVGRDESTDGCHQYSVQKHARRRLQAKITDAGLPSDRTRVIVRSQLPADAICAVLSEERPELLAIGASRWFLLKHLLIGSVADRLLRAVQCDALVIPYGASVLRLDPHATIETATALSR